MIPATIPEQPSPVLRVICVLRRPPVQSGPSALMVAHTYSRLIMPDSIFERHASPSVRVDPCCFGLIPLQLVSLYSKPKE